MVIHDNYIDGYLRSIKISIMGKSSEAWDGAEAVLQGLMRFIRGTREEDRTYDVLVEMIERLSRELPTMRVGPFHRR